YSAAVAGAEIGKGVEGSGAFLHLWGSMTHLFETSVSIDPCRTAAAGGGSVRRAHGRRDRGRGRAGADDTRPRRDLQHLHAPAGGVRAPPDHSIRPSRIGTLPPGRSSPLVDAVRRE